MACTECGYAGPAENPQGGDVVQSILVLILFLTFIVPGVIYSIYLYRGKRRCPRCRKVALIPADTPRGIQIYREAHGKGKGAAFGTKEEYQAWKAREKK
jgi:hypothetical protein